MNKPGNKLLYTLRLLRNTIYTILILIAAVNQTTAQPDGVKFDHIGLEEGLSQSTVTAIVQDARGFMWFGTQDGLNRYDGYSVKVYMNDPTDTNSISDNGVWSLLSDSRGDLWIGTEHGGLNRYVYSENRFYHYTSKSDDPASISDNYVLALFEDSNHDIWIGTHSGGLNRFNRSKQTFTRFLFAAQNDSVDSKENNVRSICEDSTGNLWIATGQGLFKMKPRELNFNGVHYTHYRHNHLDPNSLSSDNINNLFFDSHGILWIGTWGAGINSFDPKTGKFSRYVNDVKNSGSVSCSLINSIYNHSSRTGQELWIGTYDCGLFLKNIKYKTTVKYLDENVLTLYEDKSGILWIGTFENGVRILDKRKNKFVHYFENPDKTGGLNSNAIIGILLDKDRELWIAALGNVLTRYDKSRKNTTGYTLGSGSNTVSGQIYISALTESVDGNIWAGTFSGGLYRFNKKSGKFRHYKHDVKNKNSLLSDDVTSLCYDAESNVLWIGYFNGGISSYALSKEVFTHFYPDDKNPKTIPRGFISTIYIAKHSGLWAGIAGKGAVHFLTESNSFKRYQDGSSVSDFAAKHKGTRINNNFVFSIYEDDQGIIWLGTKGGGLNRYNPLTDSFTNYTVENDLPNNVVYGIEADKFGSLWLSTNKGLSRFTPQTGKFRNYDAKDGLQSNEFSEQAHFASPDGELFFGGVNGFNSFYPEEIEDNEYVPPVYLTAFKIFNEALILPDPIPPGKPIELSHSQNFFSFEFVALNYTLPEKNRYAYMIEGFDRDWHYVTAGQRTASYTNLDPGEYILLVKASNNDGIWNNAGSSIKIIVKPPYWMTLWFQIPLGLLIMLILILLYRFRVNKLLEVERIRSSIALDLHDDIGSTLTEIALYSDVSLRELRSELIKNSLNGRFRKIENLLESIGKTSRRLIDAMNDIVWAVDPKNDSFESFLLRIKTQTAQMLGVKGIDYKIEIQDRVSNLNLPLMYRRQLHLIFKEALNNVIRHARAKNVEVEMKKVGQSFLMIITDDGIGINTAPVKGGNGLNSMKKRASILKGDLEIEPAGDGGTRIELTVDLRYIN